MDEAALRSLAHSLRMSFEKSGRNCDKLDTSVRALGRHVSQLKSALRPIEAKVHALQSVHSNINEALRAANAILKEFDTPGQLESIIKNGQPNTARYFGAIARLQRSVKFFSSRKSLKGADAAILRSQGLIAEGMGKAKTRLAALLSHSEMDPAALSRSLRRGDYSALDPLLRELHVVTKGLDECGRTSECMKLYRIQRESVLASSAGGLGLIISKSDISAVSWDELKARINKWRKSLKVLVHELFPAERELAKKIFARDVDKAVEAFVSSVEPVTEKALDFVKEACACKKSPEKLFAMLDIHRTLKAAMPQFEELFSDSEIPLVLEDAGLTIKRVQGTIQDILTLFQSSVERDDSTEVGANGNVHPLTSYVMNYLKILSEYSKVLSEILPQRASSRSSGQAATVEGLIAQIVTKLHRNVEFKSKSLKSALRHLFLMNNFQYIYHNIRKNNLLTEEHAATKQTLAGIEEQATGYVKAICSEVLECFQIKSSSPGHKARSPSQNAGDRLLQFEAALEQSVKRQQSWIIPNEKQRELVRQRTAHGIIAAYSSWLESNRTLLEQLGKAPFGSNRATATCNLKYTPSNLDGLFKCLFEGNKASSSGTV